MNRLMKAEAYRFLHSGVYLRTFLFSCLLLMFVPLGFNYELLNYTFCENFGCVYSSLAIFMMIGTVIVPIIISSGYIKKTAYYEVMAGSKVRDIICSKLLIEGVFMGILIFISCGGLGIVSGIKNGWGEMEQLGARLLLLMVVFLHIMLVSVLIGLLVKNIVAGLLAYLRFCILETMISMVLPLLMAKEIFSDKICEMINKYLLSSQLSVVLGEKIDGQVVTIVLVSCLAEVVLWYGITYYTMKKRLYK